MSYKYQAQQVSGNCYVLPKVGNMKVDVKAFLSPELYAASEENLWAQIANGASYEGVKGAYLMPDCHSGFGLPIGSVVVTDNTALQCGSGYDISCGVIFMKTTLTAADIVEKPIRRKWVNAVEARISTGKGSHRPKLQRKFPAKKVDDILRYGARALGIDPGLCERDYIPIPDDLDLTKIDKAYSKVLDQLGSLGGGNHFAELQCSASGEVWVMVHCGSRGYGWQTANHYFYAGAELRGLPKNRREDSWLHLDEPLGREYWAYHNSAANFAIANRHFIVEGVREATQEVFNSDVEAYYEISHNLIQQETLVLPDGTNVSGLVHRKGATRAFPAGHPDLIGTQWETTGHPCLIPGSMFEGAAILFPEVGAYNSACSVNHGSGRVLARGEAKRQLGSRQSEINEQMNTVKRTFGGVEVEGIISNLRDIPLDECAHVYKDLDSVLTVLQEENIAKVHTRLWPVCNIKGAE